MDSFRATLAALLCCSLGLPAPPTQAQTAPQKRPGYISGALQGDARIEHALDRFTFGPRPGDVEAVRAVGLDAWFEQQLHPGSIDESSLNAHLAQFPAMQWSVQDLVFRLPSKLVIRQAMAGKISLPSSGTLHAVYENAIYRMQQQQAARAQKNEEAAASQQPAANAMSPSITGSAPAQQGSTANTSAMALATSMDELDAPADASLFAEIMALPPRERVLRLQTMQPADFEAFVHSLRPAQRAKLMADLSPDLREAVEDLADPQRLLSQELFAERLARDIYSNAQLQEVMTDFWLNHFNIYLHKDEEMPYYLVSYERDTVRPHALGRFEDLLEAVAHSPAMLLYLDNSESIGPDSLAARRAAMNAWRHPGKKAAPQGLNENYGRELMELHTLGVNGGYTQADVIQVARVLTGWTVDHPQYGGGFLFDPNRHEPGKKIVMGYKIKEGGENEGRALLHFLATRPATAQFLSRELAIRFVSDNPPQSLVDRMAKTYLATSGDISAVLRTLFHSPEFWAADNDRAKVKTPIEFVVSAARASNAQIESYEPLVNALRQMGMPLYGCIPPSGYDWTASAWVSTGALVDRMNFALSLAANRLPGVTVDWLPQAGVDTAALPSPAAEEARLEALLIPGGVSDSTRAATLREFERQRAQNSATMQPVAETRRPKRRYTPNKLEQQDQLLAGLLLGSPEFQRR